MLTYVIALNVSQARLYGLRKFRFVMDAQDLAGVQGCLVVLTGQYYLRPDWHSLKLLLTRLQNFSNVLVRLNPIDFIIAGYHLTLRIDQYTPHIGIGVGGIDTARGQLQRPLHPAAILL